MHTRTPHPVGRLLGLARRSGQVTMGLRATVSAAKTRSLGIVLLAKDSSPRTARELREASGATPVVMVESMDELGGFLGLGPVAAAGVRRGALAAEIRRVAGESKRG